MRKNVQQLSISKIMERKSFEQYLKDSNDDAIRPVVLKFIEDMYWKVCELSDNLPMHSNDFEKLLASELIACQDKAHITVHGYMDDRVEISVCLMNSSREYCDDLTVDDIYGETDYFKDAYRHCVDVYKLQLESKMRDYKRDYSKVIELMRKEPYK